MITLLAICDVTFAALIFIGATQKKNDIGDAIVCLLICGSFLLSAIALLQGWHA